MTDFGMGYESAIVLCDIIQSGWVSKVDISKNQVGNEGAKLLAKVITKSRDIISFCISNNALTKIGGEALASSLAYNSSIVDFNISSLDAMRRNKVGP